jgi:hypothetical protein
VSIIVVATEGEDRYSNTLKDLPALQRKHTVVERRICIQRVFCVLLAAAASIHKAQGTINHVFIIEDDILELN